MQPHFRCYLHLDDINEYIQLKLSCDVKPYPAHMRGKTGAVTS